MYLKVLTSVALYASPVWASSLSGALLRILRPLRGVQRAIASRAVAAYRTVSFDAVTLLARMPPWTLEASMRARVYSRFADLRCRDEQTNEALVEIREQETNTMLRQWDVTLQRPNAWGGRTLLAIRPRFREWLGRRHGYLTHYITQFLSGHGSLGSFGYYLWRMGKRASAHCSHCNSADDTVEHTLAECIAFEAQRGVLRLSLELVRHAPVTLTVVIETALASEANWAAFSSFAFEVISIKVQEERRREAMRDPVSPALSPSS